MNTLLIAAVKRCAVKHCAKGMGRFVASMPDEDLWDIIKNQDEPPEILMMLVAETLTERGARPLL